MTVGGVEIIEAAPRRRIHPLARLVRLALIVGTVMAVMRLTGLSDLVRDEERLSDLVDDAGIFGPILYTLLFTLLVPVGVPGLLFVLPAAVIFSTPVALAVVLVGGYLSSGIGMLAARRLGRDAIEARLSPRLLALNDRISRGGLGTVLAVRIIGYLAAPCDWLLGLSRISDRHLVVGTVLGLLPPTLAYVIGGSSVLDLVL